MRWETKRKHLENREVEKFAWLPVICKRWDNREIRWLEHVKVRQTWYGFGEDLRVSIFGGYWKNDWFI